MRDTIRHGFVIQLARQEQSKGKAARPTWENECTHGGVDSCPFFTSNPSKNTPASPIIDKFSIDFVEVVKTQKRKRRARLRLPAAMPENHEKWPSLDRQRHANKSVSVAALVMGDR